MKNIGIVVDNDFNSDIRVQKEVDILKKNGYNINVLCFSFNNKDYDLIEGVRVHRIKINKKLKDVLFFLFNRIPIYEYFWKRQIIRFIKYQTVDVLHVHDLYLAKSAALAIEKCELKIPLVLDLHENFPYAIQEYNWTKGKLRSLISAPEAWIKKESRYLNYATKLIVLSDSFKRALIRKHDFLLEKNIVTFPNIIDLRRFENYKINPGIEKSDRVTLMYFGVVAERRGIFDILKVLKNKNIQNLKVDLLIIGPVDKADKKRFHSEIMHPSLESRIHYIPWIELSELVSYMHISDIFLSPLKKNRQHESGVANKIYQYLYGGKPIIVSDCKPQKNLIEKFNCGLSYSTDEELIASIIKLAEDKELREKLGANGLENLYKCYDTSDHEKVLLGLYDDIFRNNGY